MRQFWMLHGNTAFKEDSMKRISREKLFTRHALETLAAFQQKNPEPTIEVIDRAVSECIVKGWLNEAYQIASLGASNIVLDELSAAFLFYGRREYRDCVLELKKVSN